MASERRIKHINNGHKKRRFRYTNVKKWSAEHNWMADVGRLVPCGTHLALLFVVVLQVISTCRTASSTLRRGADSSFAEDARWAGGGD